MVNHHSAYWTANEFIACVHIFRLHFGNTEQIITTRHALQTMIIYAGNFRLSLLLYSGFTLIDFFFNFWKFSNV